MNNNRGGNNRRRGRGSNNTRPPGTNGGQQVNRIDSRARGNAPQMLEKYRKLANDAHLNGDRVNAEYYLQFADHYFRVIADTRVRQEEQRLRRDDRWQDGDGDQGESDDGGDFSGETEFAAFDQPPVYTRREREDRPERQNRSQTPAETRRRDETPAYEQPAPRGIYRSNDQAGAGSPTPFEPVAIGSEPAASESSAEPVTAYEPPENPFLRENRGGRGLRPRREDRRPRREDRPETAMPDEAPDADRASRAFSAGIDPQILPPSFTVPRDEPAIVPAAPEPEPEPAPEPVAEPIVTTEAVAEKPARRPRAKRKPAADDAGEAVQSLI